MGDVDGDKYLCPRSYIHEYGIRGIYVGNRKDQHAHHNSHFRLRLPDSIAGVVDRYLGGKYGSGIDRLSAIQEVN